MSCSSELLCRKNSPVVFILATPGLDLQVFLFFFFFFFLKPPSFPPSLLASSSLPLDRQVRSWKIKGIARRPHERHRWAAVLNSPERLFQSERPDQHGQDPQGRGAGRRSSERIKVPGLKLRRKALWKLMYLTFFLSAFMYCMWGQVLLVTENTLDVFVWVKKLFKELSLNSYTSLLRDL